jgi:hypothetical protein
VAQRVDGSSRGSSRPSISGDSTTINPARGVANAIDGNAWCVSFTDDWPVKLDANAGTILMQIPDGSTTRGVYQLPNGNLLWANGAGVHRYDIVPQSSSLVFAGACYHLSLDGGSAGSASVTPFGVGCGGLATATNGLRSSATRASPCASA